MEYPAANPETVGKYSALCFAGGGYFWDEVLEYRVWVHGRGGRDAFLRRATFEEAQKICDNPKDFGIEDDEVVEKPLVLIKQLEWINEPSPGVFEHKTGERIAEWQPWWLEGSRRTPGAIEQFLKNPRPVKGDQPTPANN